jgi:hypothetical protein
MNRWLLLGAAFLAGVAPVHGRSGTVRTSDGRALEGPVWLDASGQVSVARVRVPAALVTQILFRADAPATGPVTAGLPTPWVARHTGMFGVMGSVGFERGTFTILGSGIDAAYFVHQPLPEEGEIVARVVSVENADPLGVAGVMLRQELTENAAFVSLGATPAGRALLQSRPNAGKGSPQSVTLDLAAPCWLKLTRTGEKVTAFSSADGQKWQQVGALTVSFRGQVSAGLAVNSHNNHQLNRAVFDNVTATTMPKEMGAQAVVLRNGSAARATITGVDALTVKFTSYGRTYQLPLIEVAQLRFAGGLGAALPGRRGALLANGDFFDGEWAGLSGGRLRISSVLFGVRTFAVPKEAVAVVLREPRPATVTWQVRTGDGSVLQTKTLAGDGDRLLVQDPALGAFRVSLADVVEIRRQK